MAKTSGLGDGLLIGGVDVSGDIGSIQNIRGGNTPIPVTGINKSAFERLGGPRDGGMQYTAYFNPTGAHPVFSALPRTDVVCTYLRGTTLGNASASMVAKQVNYDPTRGTDGSLTETIDMLANSYGLEWGTQLTAGLRTDTGATDGSSVDTTASLSFGLQAWLQVTAFSGTDVTIKIQDSANNSAWADLASAAFTAVTAAPYTQRIALGNTATVRRYLRVSTTTSGGFTSVSFAVSFTKNKIAGQVY